MLKALTLALLLSLLVLSAPASADGWQDRLGGAVIAAPNDGVLLGAALTYQCLDHLWLDAGVRRDWRGTGEFVGVSSDLQGAADLIARTFGCDTFTMPRGSRAGYAVVGDFAYLAYGFDF